jgi:hypothetical protein
MIYESNWNIVEIDGLVGLDAAQHEALAVDEHQRAVEVQVTQINEILAEAAVILCVVDALRAKRRQLIEQCAQA